MIKQKYNEYLNLITSDLDDKLYDTLLYQVNNVIYNYGDHHKSNNSHIKNALKRIFHQLYCFKFLFKKDFDKRSKLIISNAYVEFNLPQSKLYLPPWAASIRKEIFSSWALSNIIREIYEVLNKKNIKDIFSPHFIDLLRKYELEFCNLLKNNNIGCIMVPNDMSFFENYSVKLAKKINVPSFVYLHGLPARFNIIDDNRAEYLIVWGKGLKQSYVEAGFDPEKILVFKHPVYTNFSNQALRSNLKNVLVISKAMPGVSISSTEIILTDRSKSLYYVEVVKKILMKLGIKSARLRLHPSEAPEFYDKNLIDSFYTIDKETKETSLNGADLVIGPTSTMVLDAIKNGVNYILFDPIVENKTLDHENSLVKPFDGSSFIKLSMNIEDIENNIANPKDNVNIDVLNEYLSADGNDQEKFLKLIS